MDTFGKLSPNTSPKRISQKIYQPSAYIESELESIEMIWAGNRVKPSDVPTKRLLVAACARFGRTNAEVYTGQTRWNDATTYVGQCSIPPMDGLCGIRTTFYGRQWWKIPMLKRNSSFLSVRMVYKQRVTGEVTSLIAAVTQKSDMPNRGTTPFWE